jgi:hypothetical protein
MGRPRREQPLRPISVKVEETEYARWWAEAQKKGLTLAEWIRSRCNEPVTEVPIETEVRISEVLQPHLQAKSGGLVLPGPTGKKSYEPDPRPSQRKR